jgi:uracil-DNA glycosylase
MNESKFEALKKIRDEIFNLTTSPIYSERVLNKAFPVIGEGDHDSKIMFVGEAPGKNEAATGRPFCGMSGKILDELFSHINMSRKDVYITNLVKDRPTNNRDPKSNEIDLYSPFLIKQIEIIKPRVIVPLGRLSMAFIMKYFGLEKDLDVIGKIRGNIFKVDKKFGDFVIVPLYHPAVAVYNRTMLPTLKSDFEKIKKIIQE